jgi:hypothetical protein
MTSSIPGRSHAPNSSRQGSEKEAAILQTNLDIGASCHPESGTLCDFRAPEWYVEAETAALRAAEQIYTAHSYLASLYPAKSHLLPWSLPDIARVAPGDAIVFPGPTVGRKGAYELRTAARTLDLEILLLGRELEGDDFWHGVRTRRLRQGEDWLSATAVVVQPALIEDRPRPLLRAVAAGIPVIATERCGLGNLSGVQTIPCGDVEALITALSEIQEVQEGSRRKGV